MLFWKSGHLVDIYQSTRNSYVTFSSLSMDFLISFSYKVKENNLDYIFSKATANVNDPLALQCKWYSHMLSLQRTTYFEFVLFDYFTNDYEQLKLFTLFSWLSGLLLLSLLSFEVVQSALLLFTDQAKYRWIKRLKQRRKTFRRKKSGISTPS